METGEIIAIVIVVLVVVVGATFLFYRCCKAMVEVVEDDQKPTRQSAISSFGDGLRRSFRSSFRGVTGSLRSSFRRAAAGSRGSKNSDNIRSKYGTKPVVKITTIADLKKETSELHPAFMKKSLKNEGVTVEGIRNPPSSYSTSYPNPLYQKDGELQPHGGRIEYKGAKPGIPDKVRSGRSGYSKMREEEVSPTHKATYSRGPPESMRPSYSYENSNYQGELPGKRSHSPQRYDLPYDESGVGYSNQGVPDGGRPPAGPDNIHSGNVQGPNPREAIQGSQRGPSFDDNYFGVQQEDVRFNNPEKRYMSVDTYI